MPALSPKAIIEGRTSNRAPVPLIVGLVVSGLCILGALVIYLLTGGPGGTVIGAFLAMPTFVVLVALILLIDRLDPEPRLNLVFAGAWGCGVAAFVAYWVNTAGEGVLKGFLGENGGDAAAGDILAPIVEESLKGSLLLLLVLMRRNQAAKYIDGPTDAIVYAGVCALGFAFVENINYYMSSLDSPDDLFHTVLLRGVIAPLGHPLFTSMTALGVAYAASHRGAGRVFAVVGGWICAVLLHSLWNTSASANLMFVAYGIDFLVLVLLAVVLVRDRRQLVAQIRTYLPAYIPSGLVLPHDVEMLGSMPARRQARRWARANAGMIGIRAMGDYQLAATELALLHAHAANGVVGQVQFLGRQGAIVGLMRAAQDAFFRRMPHRQPAAAPSWVARHEQSGFFAKPSELRTTKLPTAQFAASQRPPQARPPAGPPQGRPPAGPPRGGPPTAPPPRPPASPPSGAPAQRPPASPPFGAPAQRPPAPPPQQPGRRHPGGPPSPPGPWPGQCPLPGVVAKVPSATGRR
jgi:RsiW-degrading membrane proteinase PrsW (M82 family)